MDAGQTQGGWAVPRYAARLCSTSAAAGFLLALHAGLLINCARLHSPTLNEPAHLVAGVSHWELGHFELYRVNPPLVRAIAAVPLLACGYEANWDQFDERPGARPVFGLGRDFAHANGERAFRLMTYARWACIPLSLLGAWCCYLWGRDLYGPCSGLLACFLYCTSPNILAHAALITPDAASAAFCLAANYAFWRWLKRPNWSRAALAGLILGPAELTKTTLLVLYVLWPAIWLLSVSSGEPSRRPRLRREAAMLAAMLVLAVYLVNLGYGFDGSFGKLKDFAFVSRLFRGEDAEIDGGMLGVRNRFAGSWVGELPVPLPKDYVLGLDIQQRDFESYKRPSYLRGEFRHGGWWYYYCYALAVKEPLGTWVLFAITALARALRVATPDPVGNARITPSRRYELVLVLPALTIFVAASSRTMINEHLRYILPCLPAAYVWLGQSARLIVEAVHPVGAKQGGLDPAGGHRRRSVRGALGIAAAIVTCWSVASSLSRHPHHLSYFNPELVGPLQGPEHLLGSNFDWGQDLLFLKRWQAQRPDAGPVRLAYYGDLDPNCLGVACKAIEKDHLSVASGGTPPGWYAVSATLLHGYPWFGTPDADGASPPYPLRAFREFRYLRPSEVAGASIFLYRRTNWNSSHPSKALGPGEPELTERIRRVLERARKIASQPLANWSAMHALLLNGPSSYRELVSSGRNAPNDEAAVERGLLNRILHPPSEGPFHFESGIPRPRRAGPKYETERHRDQFLHLLSMAGVPPWAELHYGGDKFFVRDLVKQSLREVRASGEMEKTVSAYAYYLEGDARWGNKFGEQLSLADLIEKLLDQRGGFCGGTHRLLALARALREHAGTEELRLGRLLVRTAEVLRGHAAQLARSVGEDGRIPLFEAQDQARNEDPTAGVYTGGHSLEWLVLASPFVDFDDRALRRLVSRLLDDCEAECSRFEELGRLSDQDNSAFGDLCHACSGLNLLVTGQIPRNGWRVSIDPGGTLDDPARSVGGFPR